MSSPQPLTFSWPASQWRFPKLPVLVLLSALVHFLPFVLLQVDPSEKVTAPEREHELQLLSADLPEHQSLLAAAEAESPLMALSHQLLSANDLLGRPYRSSLGRGGAVPIEAPRWTPLMPALVPPLDRTINQTTNTQEAPTPRAAGWMELEPRLQERLVRSEPVPAPPSSALLENPVFLIGIAPQGAVQFVLLQRSSGEDAADQAAELLIRKLEFKSAKEGTPETTAPEWGHATLIWGAHHE